MSQDEIRELRDLLSAASREIDSLKNAVRRASAVYLGNGRLLIPTNRGHSLIAFSDDLQIAPALINDGGWEMALTDLTSRVLKPGMRVMEVGANIGYFSVLFSFLVGAGGRVEVFEPNPRTLDVLRANVRLHNIAHVCRVHPVAIADKTGEAVMSTFIRNQGGSSLSTLPAGLLDQWAETPVTTTVPTVSLDEHFAAESTPFDFIKIDAEGAEPLVWKGGTRFFGRLVNDRTIIAMEFNPPAIKGLGHDPHQFAESVLRRGFRCWRHTPADRLHEVTRASELSLEVNTDLVFSRTPPPPRPA